MRNLTARWSRIAALGALLSPLPLASQSFARPPLPTRADVLPSPGRSVVADDTADAIAQNPSALALLPSYDIRWSGVFCPNGVQAVSCGHALEAATPLPFGFSTGLRADLLMPPSSSPFPFAGYDYAWLTWALAWRPSTLWSIGASIQHSYSPNAYVNDITGLTASLSYRPIPNLAFSVIARDFNNPAPTLLGQYGMPVLDANYILAAAVRPTGRRDFEIGLEGRYLVGTHEWIPRGTATIEVPYVGRLRGGVETSKIGGTGPVGVTATVGLDVTYGHVSAGGGALFGSGLGGNNEAAGYASLSLSGYTNGGIPRASHAVSLRIEGTPGSRQHFALLQKLWRIATDRTISAVVLELRAEPAGSFAEAEELADALRLLRLRGKKVLCDLEDAKGRSLYVCANADRIVMNPAGGLRYSGLRSQHMYLAGLLSKLGVRAEFVRIGDHKTAPEEFMSEHGSDTAHADYADYLGQVEAVFTRNLAQGRKLDEQAIRESTKHGPFMADEARAAGFIDSFAFDDELEKVVSEMVGRETSIEKYEPSPRAPLSYGDRRRIALLHIDGDIVDGRSSTVPVLGTKLVGSYSVADAVKALDKDPNVKAVVLRIDSPGGSSMASDVMLRSLQQLAKHKPLVTSMGSVAASGGYYIAVASKHIYAMPLTVTGSIGIFYGKADISGLLAKIGVNIETIRTAPRADAESLYRGFTEEERRELEHKVHQFYDVFLDRVATGRGISKEAVDAVGQGRVWTGQQAHDRHLVDELGGLREAIAMARKLAEVGDDVPVIEVPDLEPTLVEKALRVFGLHPLTLPFSFAGLPPELRSVVRTVAPMLVYEGDVPLARLDGWVGEVE